MTSIRPRKNFAPEEFFFLGGGGAGGGEGELVSTMDAYLNRFTDVKFLCIYTRLELRSFERNEAWGFKF